MTEQRCERCLEVAEKIKREAGVRYHKVVPKEGFFARWMSDWQDREVWAPRGDTVEDLLVLAHEAGHVATINANPGLAERPRLETELEATRWAMDRVRRAGIPLTPANTQGIRDALATYLREVPQPKTLIEARKFTKGETDL